MVSFYQRLRRYGFSIAAIGLHAAKACRDRISKTPFEGMPNFTRLEEYLFLGGQCVKVFLLTIDQAYILHFLSPLLRSIR